jgi:L-rhamnonate dehydratase
VEITKVEARQVPQSMWGDFWQQQVLVRGPSPVSSYPAAGRGWSWYNWPQGVVLVRVTLSDGTTGLGYAEDGMGAATLMVQGHLAGLCTGREATSTEGTWDLLFRSSIPYGRKGAAIEAISAIDIAIWDAIGKSFDLPTYKLLGGYHGKPVRAYASKIQPDDDLAEVRRMARDYVQRGYQGVKTNWPFGPADGRYGLLQNLRHVEAIRDEIGDEIELMTDAYMGWDRSFAMSMLRELADFRLTWVEEPLIPDDISGLAALKALCAVPIATGEHEFTRFGFQALIEQKAADVLQPDVHRVGGLTEFRHVCQMAAAVSLDVVPHIYSAATLHGVLSQTNCPWVEHLTTPSYWRPEGRVKPLFVGEPSIIDGSPALPTEPGIGLRINVDAVPELADWT